MVSCDVRGLGHFQWVKVSQGGVGCMIVMGEG